MSKSKRKGLGGRGVVDITGQRFGMLTARALVSSSPYAMWACICDCGRETVIRGSNLRAGDARSCGCRIGGVKHGQYKTPTYKTWTAMVARCTNPKNTSFADYGGRGITVCERWRQSFEAFFADVGERPSMKHSIDRIDNDRGYEPGNVRWATMLMQARNRRGNKLSSEEAQQIAELHAAGVKPKEIALRFGISPNLASQTALRHRRLHASS